MSEQPPKVDERRDIGLAMVSREDPQVLAEERAYLASLAGRSWPGRMAGYLKLSGPGWLQSALTLGGGSAASSLFAGALLGYSLLWVQPLAMLVGIIMMSALAYQTLSTGMRPFRAVNHFAHPLLGWGWALTSLIASIVWSFPQFNLATSVIGDALIAGSGSPPGFVASLGAFFAPNSETVQEAANMGYRILAAPLILIVAFWITWNYGKGRRGIRIFETILKILVAGVVISFAIVVFMTSTPWDKVLKGYLSFEIPKDIKGLSVLIAAFATAVGINMTFLFPYTLLARGWGREHRGLVRFDLSTGMLIPFILATSCVVIASANLLHEDYAREVAEAQTASAERLDLTEEERALLEAETISTIDRRFSQPTLLAETLVPLFGERMAYYVFGMGIIGMAVSTIILLMLVSGFILAEITGGEPGGAAYKFGMCLPGLGVLGPIIWGEIGFYLAVPTSVICFFFLPIAYLSFFIMMNRKAYLGADRPSGAKRWVWNSLMLLAIAVVGTTGSFMIYKQIDNIRAMIDRVLAWITAG